MSKNSRTLGEMSQELDGFVEARGWRVKDPARLMLNLVGEIGELSEAVNKTESFQVGEDMRKEIGFEMVDVLNYLMRLANEYGVNLVEVWEEKMPLLAEKYPVDIDRDQVGLRREEYRKSGKNKLYK
jgi:NTP pyrophosphatase (non-canonical NTP hydrolase)